MTPIIERLTDKDLIRAALSADRGRNAYMLGDLAAPFWSYAEFYGWLVEGAPRAIVLKYTQFDPPPVLTAGDPAGVEALLRFLAHDQHLKRLVYHAPPEHMAAVQRYFQAQASMLMWRMIVTPDQFQSTIQSTPLARVRRLTPVDASAAQVMYGTGLFQGELSGDFHAPTFAEGVFYGVEDGGRLLAVAGTHIIASAERIGAVGYVFTHPEARGKGYATACTGAVTRDLLDQGIDLVALNVRQDNPPAIRAYEKLGYVRHSALYEGAGRLIAD